MFDLTGKTALVTGASGGIGKAIATRLHQQGAYVILHGTREEIALRAGLDADVVIPQTDEATDQQASETTESEVARG